LVPLDYIIFLILIKQYLPYHCFCRYYLAKLH